MKIKEIYIHGGIFHSDDVMCVALARIANPQVKFQRVFKAPTEVEEGVIVAKRHIHMTDKDAVEFGVKNGDLVSVLIENENGRKTIYGDTVIRVSPSYSLAMHIDTDESNAASCARVQMGKIVD